MASLTIRRLSEDIKTRLRVRAARHRRSMEAEAREILRVALVEDEPAPGNLADDIRELFEPLGGVELEIPSREPLREPPDFGE